MLTGQVFVPPENAIYDVEIASTEVGDFTGTSFKSPRTGQVVRVHSKSGETKDAAISRVRKRHDA